jgi:hypothetical protein
VRRALVVVVALAIAGCGSSSGSSKSSTTAGRTSLGPTFDDIGTLPGAQKSAPPWDSGAKKLQQRLKAIGLQPLPVEGTVVHIHQHLDVYVDGKHVTVPALIGIGPGGSFFSPLHTHDPTGIMHVESPTQSEFTLGQFFAVWGVPLSANGIGNRKGHVRVWVNGKPLSADPTRVVLTPHQEIVVALGTAPKKVPATYSFPQGL